MNVRPERASAILAVGAGSVKDEDVDAPSGQSHLKSGL